MAEQGFMAAGAAQVRNKAGVGMGLMAAGATQNKLTTKEEVKKEEVKKEEVKEMVENAEVKIRIKKRGRPAKKKEENVEEG